MVGAPKTLSDLARIDAHLAVRCRDCGHRRAYDRAMLGPRLMQQRHKVTWPELAYGIPCRCGSTNLSLRPAAGPAIDPMMRRYERVLVRLAMDALARAEVRARTEPVNGLDVRLALHVLRPYAGLDMLKRFADQCGVEAHGARSRAITGAFVGIRDELLLKGRLDQ